MRIFLVFLAFLGMAVAQPPDTCPAPPKNLLCFIGLKNTCTDNSECRKGTLCCNDGCRKRCRDPSNNSRGAGTGTPRLGTCPSQLSPPPGPCVSDSDECMFDWDCAGSTKKCCFNKCFKECVEPSIGAIRALCPPQKKGKCHFGLKNQCSNDSECSYLPGGLCCFDGCRRRCADSQGFPSRIETERPGQCPATKPPQFCISDNDECEFDGDCYPGKKCCSNTCFTRCLDPVGLPGSNTSQTGAIKKGSMIGQVTQGEAAGKCPITSSSNHCHVGLAHTCNNDVECPNGSYCCFDGCRRKCLDPNDETAGAQGEEKDGICPILQSPELCVSDVDECFIDWDCVGDHKCCSNGCYKVCAGPAQLIGGLGAAAVKCPEPVASPCSQLMKHLCDNSSQCTTGTHCCFDGCRRRCISTDAAPDTCPKAGENLLCLIGLRNTCVDKESCPQGTLCCFDGCRRRCRDPTYSTDSGGGTTGITRPGTCPSLKPPSEFCPSDFDECKYDWDCDVPTKKCCSNGCYRVCAAPAVGAVQVQGILGHMRYNTDSPGTCSVQVQSGGGFQGNP